MPLFGTSGVRGVVGKDLTLELCQEVAQSLGTLLPPGAKVCLATDTRISREAVKAAVTEGLCRTGTNVVDLGILPTPMLACLTREWGFQTGIMLTASHNPPEYNGIKLFNADGVGYSVSQEQGIESVYKEKAYRLGARGSTEKAKGMEEAYMRFLVSRLGPRVVSGLKLVIDPGNGAASGVVARLFRELGLDVLPVNDEPDGHFPGRNPEPKEDTLADTVSLLNESGRDLAVCFDGDADRVVFCDRQGFWGFNEPTAYISRLMVQESGKKTVASTVEAGKLLELSVTDLGCKVVRGKVGDVHLAYLTRESNAAIGTEQVGVYIIPEAGFYPESIFAALKLAGSLYDVAEVRGFFAGLPELHFLKEKVRCENESKAEVMAEVEQQCRRLAAPNMITLDGIRLEFEQSWMLIRASGTEPAIRIIVESTSRLEAIRLLDEGATIVGSVVAREK